MVVPGETHGAGLKKLKEAFAWTVDEDKLKTKFDISNFGANAVVRGMQLTLVGGNYTSYPPFAKVLYQLD